MGRSTLPLELFPSKRGFPSCEFRIYPTRLTFCKWLFASCEKATKAWLELVYWQKQRTISVDISLFPPTSSKSGNHHSVLHSFTEYIQHKYNQTCIPLSSRQRVEWSNVTQIVLVLMYNLRSRFSLPIMTEREKRQSQPDECKKGNPLITFSSSLAGQVFSWVP